MSGSADRGAHHVAAGGSWSATLRVPRILWAALVMSCVIYGVLIGSGVLAQNREEPIVLDLTMAIAFGVVALTNAVISFVLPASMMSRALANAAPSIAIEERAVVDEATLFRDAAPRVRAIAEPAAARAIFAPRFFTPFILALALSESVAIFGLAGHVAGFFPREVALVFVAAGIVLQLVRFPSAPRCIALTERAWNAKWPAE